MGSLMVIDSNIISLFILVIVYVASISINLTETSKKSYFYNLIFVTMLMLVIQSAIKLIVSNSISTSVWLVNPLRFMYNVLVPVLPAIWALYITQQKSPRLLRDKIIVMLFFIPTCLNLLILTFGINNQLYTIIFSMIPIVYTLFIIVKFNFESSRMTNIAYIIYITIAAFASIVDTISLAGVCVSILMLFISAELAAFRMDPLTKISSRRHLYSYLERIIRNKKNFTLVMLDMDKLKYINDNFGHLAGDEAIKTVTSIIKTQIRQKDFFARYAGDEFMIIVDSCDTYIIKSFLNRIDKSFIAYNETTDKKYNLSVSCGYYINDNFGENINELIEKADNNMFKNKRKKLVKNWQKNIQLVSTYK